MKHRDRLSLFERLASRAKTHTWFNPLGLHNECWTWCGSKCNKGYGHIRVAGKTMRVHIAAWELAKGRKVRRGYTLDHGCRNKACWRPSHMEEVTRAVNTARGNRANPRSTERARAVKAAIGERLRGVRGSMLYVDETVNPVTPSPSGGG